MSLFSAVGVLLCSRGAVAAETLLSTMGQTPYERWYGDGAYLTFACDFRTGSTPTILTGLTIRLANTDSIDHHVAAEIWSNHEEPPEQTIFQTPLALVDTFETFATVPARASVGSDYSMSDTGIYLAPDTTYWLAIHGLEPIADEVRDWGFDLAHFQDADPGGAYSTISYTFLWVTQDAGANWYGPTDAQFLYRLEGTPVPEPAYAAVVLAPLASGLVARRRLSRRGVEPL
jgi:hypothetical protein